MLPYQQQVVEEKAQLDERLGRLNLFFDTQEFSRLTSDERDRLMRQAEVMEIYSEILRRRIEAFPA